MKRFLFLVIILCIGTIELFGQLIPDDNFKSVINQALGQPSYYEPTIADLNYLTGSLSGMEENISSIEGAGRGNA